MGHGQINNMQMIKDDKHVNMYNIRKIKINIVDGFAFVEQPNRYLVQVMKLQVLNEHSRC